MLEVEHSGGSSVKISTKPATLWVDPKSRRTADKSAEMKDVVQIATQPQLLEDQNGDLPVLEGPGEYEAGPFSLTGIAVAAFDGEGKVTSYRLETQGVSIGILGNGQMELDEDQLEMIGIVDLLLVPLADGVVGPSSHQVAQLVRQIEPKAVLPLGVSIKDTTQEPSSVALAELVKELNAVADTSGKFKIKAIGDLPAALTIYLPA